MAEPLPPAESKMSIVRTLEWLGELGGRLRLLDQRALPEAERYLECGRPEEVFDAIQTLAVRGAPAIGVAAAYGVVLGVQAGRAVEEVADFLVRARPTAVNLAWACARLKRVAREWGEAFAGPGAGVGAGSGTGTEKGPESALAARLLLEARAIEAEDREMCRAIGEHGARLVRDGGGVLTHCNAGALATAGIGTAVGVIYAAHGAGRRFRVYADETRPLLQGARLTAWELSRAGVDVTLICDGMSGSLMARGQVDLAIVGADRIARNGDTANKIGTYNVAVLAKEHGIPFYVAAPSSTFDLTIASGKEIPIEERAADEVRGVQGKPTAPGGVKVWNPAFDVTPAALIAGIITEKGIIERPNEARVMLLLGAR